MGVTLDGCGHSADLSVSGFHRMRRDIAGMFDKDLADCYGYGFTHTASLDTRTYQKKMQAIADDFEEKYGYRKTKQMFDFLLVSDIQGSASYGFCKNVYTYLKNHPDDPFFKTIYGYAGWKNTVTGLDLFWMLETCADKKKPLKWR